MTNTIARNSYESSDAQATEALGEFVGARLKGGETIELSSDLGGGKTTFVRGVARGAGSSDHVASPTFTVSREYQAANGLRLYHFDFYRLHEPGVVAQELDEAARDPQAVVLVEWSDIVQDVLPGKRLKITISQAGGDQRRLQFETSPELAYLLPPPRESAAHTGPVPNESAGLQ